MNELGKKFYEYLEKATNWAIPTVSKYAHDLAKIACSICPYAKTFEKENEEIRKLNKVQVLENAKLRVKNAELNKAIKILQESEDK